MEDFNDMGKAKIFGYYAIQLTIVGLHLSAGDSVDVSVSHPTLNAPGHLPSS